MKRLLAACAAAALGAPDSASAETAAHAAFDRGVQLYQEGGYEAAAEAFSEIVEGGVEDPAVHYNLANAWFKADRIGPAIYHYRRALALAPRDEDIAANLEYARFLALDRIEEAARTDRPVRRWLDRVTPDEVVRVSALLWILAGAAGCAWQLARRGGLLWRRSFMVLLALWAVSFAGALAVEQAAARMDEAVVLAGEAPVRNGPGESFETAFVLHAGAEVVVEGERGTWTEVSLPGDLRGWIPDAQLARL